MVYHLGIRQKPGKPDNGGQTLEIAHKWVKWTMRFKVKGAAKGPGPSRNPWHHSLWPIWVHPTPGALNPGEARTRSIASPHTLFLWLQTLSPRSLWLL